MGEPIIFDTDIGSDIDDAYALALILQCPELELIGVTVGHGPTRQRARIALKMLHCAGRNDVPVAVGTESDWDVNQAPWAKDFDLLSPMGQPAAEFVVETIDSRPGEITLICVGPFTNLGDALELDPAVMQKARRVIVMGGCIGLPDGATPEPYPEYNATTDAEATKKLLASCGAITLVPLDVTKNVPLSERNRQLLAEVDLPLPRALTELYEYWPAETPLLHDPLAVGMAVLPRFCQTERMRISVDDAGATLISEDGIEMAVCSTVEAEAFLHFFMSRLLSEWGGR